MKKDLAEEVEDILNFYEGIDVHLSEEEFLKSLPKEVSEDEAIEEARAQDYEFRDEPSERSRILNEKWNTFFKLRKYFSLVPFVEFVLMAGSMAIGNVHKDSDFDVIVGVKEGRIFTTRFLMVGLFSILGVRRGKEDSKSSSSNKICLNHFVTQSEFTLDPPYNFYWKQLYRKLIPVYGKKEKIRSFFEVNNQWSDCKTQKEGEDLVHGKNVVARALEIVFGGKFGDLVEKTLKKYQTGRIEKNKSGFSGKNPRLRYDSKELRFHMDTSRIETMIDNMDNS